MVVLSIDIALLGPRTTGRTLEDVTSTDGRGADTIPTRDRLVAN
jgi:hypothetical protein